MLVLSRRLNEKVLFPTLNTAVQVVSIKGGTVLLGIEAPPEVTILRAELQDRTAERGATTRLPEPAGSRLRGLRHLLRNRLSVTTVGLGLLRQQARAGLSDELEPTIAKIEEDMHLLRQRLESEAATTPGILPSPPMMMRAKALKMRGCPIIGDTSWIGASAAAVSMSPAHTRPCQKLPPNVVTVRAAA